MPLQASLTCVATLILLRTAVAADAPRPGSLVVHRPPAPLAAGAVVADWPRLLGPAHDGSTPERPIRRDWDGAGPPLLWEAVRGSGYAAPAVVGDAVIYWHRVGAENVVELRAALDGAPRWARRFPTDYRDRYGYADGPRAGPVVAGDSVVLHSQEGVLRCLALADGATRWERALSVEFSVPQDFFGVGSTPLALADRVIVNVGAPDGPGVAAFALADGRTLWTCDDQWGPSYAAPVPARLAGRERVLVFAGGDSDPPVGGLLCVDPADGAIAFRVPWRSRSYESVNAASPVWADDSVFITASYGAGGCCVRVKPDGTHETAWTSERLGSHFSTLLLRDGHLYGFDGRHDRQAELVCLDLATGAQRWRDMPEWMETDTVRGKPVERPWRLFRGQLLWADGMALALGEAGHLAALELTPKGCRVLAKARLFLAPESWTPPALSRGLLYVCQNHRGADGSPTRMLCYDLRGRTE